MRPMPPEEMELDDDNDSLESMVDPSGAVEGAHMNSDLYDAYANPGTSHGTYLLRSATCREDWAFLRDTSPDGWSPPIPVTAPSMPPITRRPSIRRLPGRTRTADIDCTDNGARSDAKADDSTAQTTRTAASNTSPRAIAHQKTTSVPPRRFFPSRHAELPWSPVPESTTTATGTNAGTGSGMGTGTVATPSARVRAPHQQRERHGHKQQKHGTNARSSDGSGNTVPGAASPGVGVDDDAAPTPAPVSSAPEGTGAPWGLSPAPAGYAR